MQHQPGPIADFLRRRNIIGAGVPPQAEFPEGVSLQQAFSLIRTFNTMHQSMGNTGTHERRVRALLILMSTDELQLTPPMLNSMADACAAALEPTLVDLREKKANAENQGTEVLRATLASQREQEDRLQQDVERITAELEGLGEAINDTESRIHETVMANKNRLRLDIGISNSQLANLNSQLEDVQTTKSLLQKFV